MRGRETTVETLSGNDIRVPDEDLIILKGQKFYRPFITAAAINDDIVEEDGQLGSLMLAQKSATRGYSGWTGLPDIEEKIFVVEDGAEDAWENLKQWIKRGPVKVMETRIPNVTFKSLFDL
jgi:hypothetical protein